MAMLVIVGDQINIAEWCAIFLGISEEIKVYMGDGWLFTHNEVWYTRRVYF